MTDRYALAPIVIFAYKRPKHLKRLFASLGRNPSIREARVYIYCDGPKADASPEDLRNIELVRTIARSFELPSALTVRPASANKGLAASIIDGVSEVLADHDRAIILEDDLICSPYALRYFNEALNYYQSEERVYCVSGYSYPALGELPETFFLRGADCWGWATWRRAWAQFNPDGRLLLELIESQGLERIFDYDGRYPYTQMLRRQTEGQNQSWAIRWNASVFLRGGLTVYPGRSLVENLGQGGGGTHSAPPRWLRAHMARRMIQVGGIQVVENRQARHLVGLHLERLSRPPARNSLRRLLDRTGALLRALGIS